MAGSDFRLRALLLEIDRQLSDPERKSLCFIIGSEDVPRRLIDAVTNHHTVSMEAIWEALFDRRKITVDNVNYLIERLEKIERPDLAEQLKNYCPVPFSLSTTPTTVPGNPFANQTGASNLFHRIDP